MMKGRFKGKRTILALSLAVVFAFGLLLPGVTGAEEKWYPSRYGKDDELGAINEITTEKILNAFKLVKEGKLYDMGQVYEDGIPAFPPRYWKTWILFHGEQRTLGTNKVTYLEEVINASLGVGTQIDGLAHVGIDSVYYNGNHQKDFATPTGVKKFGMEKVPPVVTRGVLIDMAAYRGVPMMEAGDAIMPEDIQGALKKQGDMKLEPGDVVIFHTGWMSLWMKDNKKFASGEPGIGIEAAEWLAEQRVAMVGSDTWGVEVIPFQYKGRIFEPHQILLTKAGIYLLENLVTEQLAKDKVYEFLFVLTHPRTKGTPQAITAPLAIR